MKKINSILMILAAAAGFTNCTKAEFVDNKEAGNSGTVVYATTDAATKTALTDDYDVLWSEGDQIKFIKDDAPATTYTFTLSNGEGTTSGTFTCTDTPEDGEYTVYFPVTYDGTNWPAQTYLLAQDISGAPMKATATVSGGSVSDITFTNEGGILRYTVKGSKTIRSINVKSASPALDVTLDCEILDGTLTAEGTVFNIALPAGEYSNATLTFTATDYTVATKTAASFKVTKNVISLATFESSDLSFVTPPAPDGFVDLGVTDANGKPLYWAKCNLGATKAEEYGDYFAWGETAPYYEGTGGWPATLTWKAGKTSGYAWQSYCGSSSFAEWSTPPYDASTRILKSAYDAATVANSSWRTPTSNEFQSLKNNCYCEWTEGYNGTSVKGIIVYKAKAAGDKGKYGGQTGYTTSDTHIFLPAAGFGNNTGRSSIGGQGVYWSSSFYLVERAYSMDFSSSYLLPNYNSNTRYGGFSVRPVTTEAAAPTPGPTLPEGALAGVFTVSDDGAGNVKKVHFSQGNLYFDGSAFKFETNQYDFQSSWSTSHVSHFYWSKDEDVACAEDYNESGTSVSDVFFTNAAAETAKADFTVNGVTGKYRTLSKDEWVYLFNTRTVNGGTGEGKSYSLDISYADKMGVVLYPDDYTGSVLSGTVESLPEGVVFLPAAGYRNVSYIDLFDTNGYYWSSSLLYSDYAYHAYHVYFYSEEVNPVNYSTLYNGYSVRLITECQ